MECETCDKMTEWYLKQNPGKRGFVLCESCYEESKQYFVYMNLPYQPESIKREDLIEMIVPPEPDRVKKLRLKRDLEFLKRCSGVNEELLGCDARSR